MLNFFNNFISIITCLAPILLNCFTLTAVQASEWSPPYDLSPQGKDAMSPQMAVDKKGNAAVVWSSFNGSYYSVLASTSKTLGEWSIPVTLSKPGENALSAQVAIGADGTIIAIWSSGNDTYSVIQSAFKKPMKPWSEPINLSSRDCEIEKATVPQIAIGKNGHAIAIWQIECVKNSSIQAATRNADFSWSSPVNLTPIDPKGKGYMTSKIAFDRFGNAIAVWINKSNSSVEVATKSFGKRWSSPLQVSEEGSSISSPEIVIDGRGETTLVWSLNNGTNNTVQASTRSSSGLWSGPTNLSTIGSNAISPKLATNQSGTAIAVWENSNNAQGFIEGAYKHAGMNWSPSIVLSPKEKNASEPQVSSGYINTDVVIWKENEGKKNFIQAITRHTDGPWSEATNLSEIRKSHNPQVIVNIFGDAIAIWEATKDSKTIIQTSFKTGERN